MIWTAVGAIATTIAVIVALFANYWANRNNKKNRDLQISLLRQQRAQKKLDELVQNVMQLSKSMRPLDILYYSSKLIEDKFTIEDCRFLEQLAVDDECGTANIYIPIAILENYDSAKPVLDGLHELRQNYGLWSRSVSTLFKHKSLYRGFMVPSESERVVGQIVKDMLCKCIEYDAEGQVMADAISGSGNMFEKAIVVMNMFERVMAKCIQQQKNMLEKELLNFVRIEQKRIDRIAE